MQRIQRHSSSAERPYMLLPAAEGQQLKGVVQFLTGRIALQLQVAAACCIKATAAAVVRKTVLGAAMEKTRPPLLETSSGEQAIKNAPVNGG